MSMAARLTVPSGIVLLALAATTMEPRPAIAQNCTYHAEPNRGDWVDCGGGGGVAPVRRNYFAAIAISPSTLISGSGYAYPTRDAAERRALAQCASGGHQDCKLVIWVQNTCMAVATDTGHAYGAAGGRTRASAQQTAIEWCRKGGGQDCTVDYAWCP